MGDLVIKRGPTEFDHVVLATRDTRLGAGWLADLTGADPVVTEPEPGEWYWSAALPLQHGAMLEMLGPNPDHRGFHPLKATLSRYTTPEPLFWHLATADFDRFLAQAAKLGAPVERIEHLDNDSPNGRRTYSRGILGPGFRTVRPCVIEWKARPDRPGMSDPVCRATRFELRTPDAAKLNTIFEGLDLSLRAEQGPQFIALQLDTLKGEVTFEGQGVVFEGIGALAKFLRLRLAHAFGR